MGFFNFGKAHAGPLYGFLPSADIGQMVYCDDGSETRAIPYTPETQHPPSPLKPKASL
jgi:hypothetical protein